MCLGLGQTQDIGVFYLCMSGLGWSKHKRTDGLAKNFWMRGPAQAPTMPSYRGRNENPTVSICWGPSESGSPPQAHIPPPSLQTPQASPLVLVPISCSVASASWRLA